MCLGETNGEREGGGGVSGAARVSLAPLTLPLPWLAGGVFARHNHATRRVHGRSWRLADRCGLGEGRPGPAHGCGLCAQEAGGLSSNCSPALGPLSSSPAHTKKEFVLRHGPPGSAPNPAPLHPEGRRRPNHIHRWSGRGRAGLQAEPGATGREHCQRGIGQRRRRAASFFFACPRPAAAQGLAARPR